MPSSSTKLFQLLSDRTYKYKVLELIPKELLSEQQQKELYICNEFDGELSIGLLKRNFLFLFKEAHEKFNSYLSDHGELNNLTQTQLWDLYHMTVMLLLTTPENHTAVLIHELVFNLLLIGASRETLILDELELLLTLSNCKISRVNKSSSLWLLITKTFISAHNEGYLGNSYPLELVIDKVFRSCKLHYANYYATSFMKWVIGFLRICEMVQGDHIIDDYYDKFQSLAFGETTDSAIWSMFQPLILVNESQLNQIVFDYNRFSDRKFETIDTTKMINDYYTNNKETIGYRIEHLIASTLRWRLKSKVPWIYVKLLLTAYYQIDSKFVQVCLDSINKRTDEIALAMKVSIEDLTSQYGVVFHQGKRLDESNALLMEDLLFLNNTKEFDKWMKVNVIERTRKY